MESTHFLCRFLCGQFNAFSIVRPHLERESSFLPHHPLQVPLWWKPWEMQAMLRKCVISHMVSIDPSINSHRVYLEGAPEGKYQKEIIYLFSRLALLIRFLSRSLTWSAKTKIKMDWATLLPSVLTSQILEAAQDFKEPWYIFVALWGPVCAVWNMSELTRSSVHQHNTSPPPCVLTRCFALCPLCGDAGLQVRTYFDDVFFFFCRDELV